MSLGRTHVIREMLSPSASLFDAYETDVPKRADAKDVVTEMSPPKVLFNVGSAENAEVVYEPDDTRV